MSELELSEKIDQYLQGKLEGQSLSDFQEMIRKDPVLAAKIKEQITLLEKLRYYNQRKELKEKLESFHQELDHLKPTKNNQRFLYISKSSLAMAASISAVLLVSVSFYFGFIYSSKGKHISEYQLLSKEMKKIEEAQHAIIKDLNASKNTAIAEAHFSGTGFLISSQGYILTSNHLIKNADSIFAENSQTGRIKVQKVYTDTQHDIALLKIGEEECKALGKIPFLLKKKGAELGEKVFTLGFPREDIVYGEGSVSSGSGYEGDTLAYQISIPLNPGNSGGPLLDEQGNLIGIISGKNPGAEASSYAVKAEYIREFLNYDKDIAVPQKNSIAYMKRSEQIKKLKPFIFNIRVY